MKPDTGSINSNDQARVGAVFTPETWTRWLIERNSIIDEWLGGASVLDPTCGEGEFLVSLVRGGIEKGIPPRRLPLERLSGIEKEGSYLKNFLRKIEAEFGLDFPVNNLHCCDLLLEQPPVRADILVGNPPWQNFADLPSDYKEKVKPLFERYGLVKNRRDLLLGGSRIDIAALIIAKAIRDHLREHGSAYFFIPLSLLLNEGAHSGFRKFNSGGTDYALRDFFDFDTLRIFPGVSTRYGAAHFERDRVSEFPVPCYSPEGQGWKKSWATPLFTPEGPLSIFESTETLTSILLSRMALPREAKPRQGVNTCGANGTLIFTNYERLDDVSARVSCGDVGRVRLPARFLYPLLERGSFIGDPPIPRRYILLPYDERSGKPLDAGELCAHPELESFLGRVSERLKSRKGTLLGSWIRRGFWWASLGVGRYSFSPWKVAWLSYGQTDFQPKIFGEFNGKPWQGNQALHAYIPCESLEYAEGILRLLNRPEVRSYLHSFRMEGTRSWAQPGRITRLFEFT